MLSSIHPLGERGKGNRFWRTASAFAIGSIVGGAALGLAGGLVGAGLRATAGADALSGSVSVAALGAVALVGAGFEASGRSLPSLHRQVDERWLQRYRGWVYGLGYGVQLGAGVTTYITSAAVVVLIVAIVLVGAVGPAVGLGALFGLVRGLSLVPARRIHSTDGLVAFHRALARTAPAAQALSASALVLLGAVGVGTTLL